MNSLAEIEIAVKELTVDEKQQLFGLLATEVAQTSAGCGISTAERLSILDIPSVKLGAMFHEAFAEDDLLGEMLEGRV